MLRWLGTYEPRLFQTPVRHNAGRNSNTAHKVARKRMIGTSAGAANSLRPSAVAGMAAARATAAARASRTKRVQVSHKESRLFSTAAWVRVRIGAPQP